MEPSVICLTPRQHYACQMMSAVLTYQGPWSTDPDKLAKQAIRHADALMAALGEK